MNEQDMFVGLDIGTTKVVAVVVSKNETTGQLDVLGTGHSPCDGLKRGVVTNIGKTAEAIRTAIEKAEQQSGQSIENVVVGVSGDHISTFHTRAIVTTSSSEITETDIRRLHHELAQVRITPDKQILHVIPQDYIIDGQDGISDPLGMSGRRLEANALVVTASSGAVENINRCAERANLHIDAIVLQPLASALAVLDEAEREVGVAIIDIGGGTTDVAVFKDHVLRHATIISIAGQKVTDDIVAVLGIRSMDAERIKKDHGHADTLAIMRDESFQVPGVAGRTPTELSKTVLSQIIEPRVEEIYEIGMRKLMESGWAQQLSAGVVVTGGCSMLQGADSLAHRLYSMPVNIGIPHRISAEGLAKEVSSPVYSTAVGLALYAVDHEDEFEERSDANETLDKEEVTLTEQHPSSGEGFMTKLKDWFEKL